MPDDHRLALATFEFLEAAYRWSPSDTAWLDGVLDAVRRVWGAEQWAYGCFYDASNIHSFKIWSLQTRALPAALESLVVPMADRLPPELVAGSFRSSPGGLGSALGMHDPVIKQALREAGTEDCFGLNALDPEGLGCLVAVGVQKSSLDPIELDLFRRMSAHLASAYRCRRRLRANGHTPFDGAEAVLDAGGKTVDAVGFAHSQDVRHWIEEAAREILAVRHQSTRRDPTVRWKPRIQTRWTLMDAVESDGKRYLVARENQAATPMLDVLTERERQVVASAAYGRSNKEIAYDLGISHSTTRVLLARACARLGVRNRRELLDHAVIRWMRGEGGPAMGSETASPGPQN